MLKEAIFALAASFCVIMLFYVLIPVWNGFYTTLDPIAIQQVTDPTFATLITTLPTNINVLIQYSFIAMILGLGIYIILIPWRKEPTEGYR